MNLTAWIEGVAILVFAAYFLYQREWILIGIIVVILLTSWTLAGCGGSEYPRDPCAPIPEETLMCDTCPGVCK